MGSQPQQTLAKLNYLGITTPLEFADKKESWVRSHFTKPGLQTWKELNGIPCIDTSEVAQRQTICTSRSFGNLVTDYDELQASVASFAASCANKLRGQHSLTSAVTVFVSSNRFREDLPQYSNGQTRILPMPTSDFTKPGLQTWKELNGIPCIDTSEVAQRQTICTSRSFGNLVTDYDELQASVASFAASCANKLRGQHSLASAVTVFVASNRFREDLSQFSNGQTRILPMPTSDTIEITQAALAVLKEIYREGVSYKKTGVVLGNITDASYVQQNIFDEVKNRPERMHLM